MYISKTVLCAILLTIFVLYSFALDAQVSAGSDHGIKASLDETGDSVWVKTSNPTVGYDAARGVAVDSTGVYIVGYESTGDYDSRWRIEKRRLDDGELLWAVTGGPESESADAYGVAVDSSGLYVVGNEHSNQHWRIEKRRLDNGELIWAKTSDPTDDWDEAQDVAVDDTGVYVVGWQGWLFELQWRIEKRNLNDGKLIWAKTSDPSSGYDEAYGIALDSSGLYAVGYDSSPGNKQWRIEKRELSDGELIWAKMSNPSEEDEDLANAVAVDDTGIYVVGYSGHSYTADIFQYLYYWWRIEKRQLDNGELIWATTSNPSIGMDIAYDAAVDSAGLYVVGCDWSPEDRQWRFEERSLDNGDLIVAETYNPSEEDERAYGVAIDNTGLYIVGTDYSIGEDDCQWRIEKISIPITPSPTPTATPTPTPSPSPTATPSPSPTPTPTPSPKPTATPTPSPSPSPTAPPSPSPSPSASPSTPPSPTPSGQGPSLPTEVTYAAIAAIVIVIIVIAGVALKKRQNKISKATMPPPPPPF